ncbi:MAG: hypothetical protein HC904_02215 [Blastochloris sp.]|nr:hypothetical protein [Blastochloris sp.]
MSLIPHLRLFLLPLALGAWGCVLLRLHFTGQLSQLQNPAYHPLTLAFALLLVALCLLFPLLFDPSPPTLFSTPVQFIHSTLPLFFTRARLSSPAPGPRPDKSPA